MNESRLDIYRERLRKLADHIEKLPPERLDMDLWCSGDAKGVSCGTAGCALGHAVALWPDYFRFGNPIRCGALAPGTLTVIDGEDREGFDAAVQFFGTDRPFYAGWYGEHGRDVSPADVAYALRDAAERLGQPTLKQEEDEGPF